MHVGPRGLTAISMLVYLHIQDAKRQTELFKQCLATGRAGGEIEIDIRQLRDPAAHKRLYIYGHFEAPGGIGIMPRRFKQATV